MKRSGALDALRFDNTFVHELPGDETAENRRRQVYGACFSPVLPTPVAAPKLVAWSPEVAELVGIDSEAVQSQEFVEVFSGNRVLEDMAPYAACYGGHQFGNWAGQLGDGRAITLGEVVNEQGERWELQLKGAGPTPYSRTADGRAVLRSSVREFLCSEAMAHLGVPTTRALSLVLTGDQVLRDMFYNGNAAYEPGAVVCRVAPSFLRFGSFEIFAARGDTENLKVLADYAIRHHFPELLDGKQQPDKDVYVAWYAEVCRRTAVMIAHWMRVGFVHGVMNTDNLSILGLTIDYGPYGWLEGFDPGWTPNTTDASQRRYRYGNQPRIGMWNLMQLGNAIFDLVGSVEPLQAALDAYGQTFEATWKAMSIDKLGLDRFEEATDSSLIDELMEVLQLVETDMTIFYRKLADFPVDRAHEQSDRELLEVLIDAYYEPSALLENPEMLAKTANWLRTYADRVKSSGLDHETRRTKMNAVNPKYVLRNYLAQLAIDASEAGDHSLIYELLEVMRRPYDEQPEMEKYAAKRPEWARERAGCSMLSCSS